MYHKFGKVIMRVQWFLGRRIHMYQKLYQLKVKKTNSWNLGQYKDSLRTVMCTSEINKNDGYDEPEYKEAMDTYRKNYLLN